MKAATALACAALVLNPTLAAAGTNTLIQVPAGWARQPLSDPGTLVWRRRGEFLRVDVSAYDGTLHSFVDETFPASGRGVRIIGSGPTTACAGKQRAWRIVLSLAGNGRLGIIEAVAAVDGRHGYIASYSRLSTAPRLVEAERAIRTLCIKSAATGARRRTG